MKDILDRFKGSLYLGALGDAFGYVVEFMTTDEIQRKFSGPISFLDVGHIPFLDENAEIAVSDDTQMTLFTAEGVVDAFQNLSGKPFAQVFDHDVVTGSIRRSYLDWLKTQLLSFPKLDVREGSLVSFPELYKRQAPGMTCLSACSSGAPGYREGIGPVNDSMGCGGVMRVAPIGFLTGLERTSIFNLGDASAALTHGHSMGHLPAGAMALILSEICAGKTVAYSVREVLQFLSQIPEARPLCEILDFALMFEGNQKMSSQTMELIGGGWVGHECLAMGVAAAILDAPIDYRMSVAANHSGDSDSTASIAGQLIGAFEGYSALAETFPDFENWVSLLDVKAPLQVVERRFSALIGALN